MVKNPFRSSHVQTKSGINHTIFWTNVETVLWKDKDVSEKYLSGYTKKGRKFFGHGMYIKDELVDVHLIVPQRSIGWKPVNEIKGVNIGDN